MRRGIIAAVVAGAAGVTLGLTPVSGAFAAGLPQTQTQPSVQAPQGQPSGGDWNWCNDWRGGRWSDWRDWRHCCDRWDRWCWDNHGRGGDGRFDDHRHHHHHWNDRDWGRGGYAGYWDGWYWR
ncbi:hypothetical protein ACFVGY_04930 [Streptomyces sp. NPDC127106]|uniref:hypothetical protein n=1 Tax=Streptomyces sp. NPDC127106 TaxID=3345360 RepID=UPI00363E3A71